jgi:hypothetical protein
MCDCFFFSLSLQMPVYDLKSYRLLLCSICFQIHHFQLSCYLADDKVLLNKPRYDMVRKLQRSQIAVKVE